MKHQIYANLSSYEYDRKLQYARYIGSKWENITGSEKFSLHSVHAHSTEFKNSHFLGGTFRRAHLLISNFEGIIFEQCDFADTYICKSKLKNVTFKNMTFHNTVFNESVFEDCVFEKCAFVSCSMACTVFKNVLFKDCDMEQTGIYYAKFENTQFVDCTNILGFNWHDHVGLPECSNCEYSSKEFNFTGTPKPFRFGEYTFTDIGCYIYIRRYPLSKDTTSYIAFTLEHWCTTLDIHEDKAEEFRTAFNAAMTFYFGEEDNHLISKTDWTYVSKKS